MKSRTEFGHFVRQFHETGSGAEVGTRYGLFARQIAKFWDGRIVCVDLWTDEEIFEVAQVVLDRRMFHLHRGDSIEVAGQFKDEGLDWLYLDADHSYPAVLGDLDAWFPKVRPGGVVAGHDYVDSSSWGVKKAVDEFAARLGYTVQKTTDDFWYGREYPTWWFIK